MFLCGVMETYRKNLRICEFLLKFGEILVKFILNMARLVEIGEKLFGNPFKFGEVKKKNSHDFVGIQQNFRRNSGESTEFRAKIRQKYGEIFVESLIFFSCEIYFELSEICLKFGESLGFKTGQHFFLPNLGQNTSQVMGWRIVLETGQIQAKD